MNKDEAYFRKKIEEAKSLVEEIDEGNLYLAAEIAEIKAQLKVVKKIPKGLLGRISMRIHNKNA